MLLPSKSKRPTKAILCHQDSEKTMTSLPLSQNKTSANPTHRLSAHSFLCISFYKIKKNCDVCLEKTHKDTPPMPCNCLAAEKAAFPFLILFSTVVTKRTPSYCSPKLQRLSCAVWHSFRVKQYSNILLKNWTYDTPLGLCQLWTNNNH